MKKSLELLITLVLIFTGTACYAQNALLKEKDQVHYTEHVFYGDKSVVDGVVVEADLMFDEQLFWNVVYQIGDMPKETVSYEYSDVKYVNARYISSGSIYFNSNSRDIVSDPEVFMDGKDYDGLMGAFQELAQNTQAGTQSSAVVYLKDYEDFYGFTIDLELPTDGWNNSSFKHISVFFSESELREEIKLLEESGTNPDELKQYKEYLKVLEAFQNYFKIPVLEEEAIAIVISKDEQGLIDGWGTADSQGGMSSGPVDIPLFTLEDSADHFDFSVFSVFSNQKCYFTFDPYTFNGNLVDLSYIPGGYGIYSFEYDEKENLITIDSLDMVYPLDTNRSVVEMKIDENENNIILFTKDENLFYMDIIDKETLQLMDSFVLGLNNNYLSSWIYEDFIVVSSENLMVFEKNVNGRYVQKLSVNTSKIKTQVENDKYTRDILTWNTCFDWDGEKLLFAKQIWDTDGGWRSQYTTNFHVGAVDETGIIYYGEYESTLDTANFENIYYENCMFNRNVNNPLKIHWK